MFVPVPTPAEMAQWDQAAAALGVPEDVLMENAAREALAVLRRRYGPLAGARVLLLMGGGNNGGDAACLARHLLDAGARPLVLHTRPLSSCGGAAGRYAELARRLGVPFLALDPAGEKGANGASLAFHPAPDIIVDGLLGTGFAGSLREREAGLVARINALADRSFILALDVPSGLNAATGRPAPDAVRAAVTVTFQAAKPGLLLPEAAPWIGALEVRPIGMPRRVQADIPASFRMWRDAGAEAMEPADPYALQPEGPRLRHMPRGRRPGAWHGPGHKGEAGRVLIAGGSEGLSGAPCLAAWGALRGGAGLIAVAVPEAAAAALRANLPEVTTTALPRCVAADGGEGAEWSARHGELLAPLVRAARAVVAGPGMGRDNGAEAALEALLALPDRPPLLLDADALYALGRAPELLGLLKPCDVLTPHPGEAAFLLGTDAPSVQADRFAALAGLAALAPAVWVLKGAGTLIACPGEASCICPCNAPNLAVGGSGDVLAGLIGALLARGCASSVAACLGVHLHALAGLSLARSYPRRGNGPRDVADALPPLLDRLDDLPPETLNPPGR